MHAYKHTYVQGLLEVNPQEPYYTSRVPEIINQYYIECSNCKNRIFKVEKANNIPLSSVSPLPVEISVRRIGEEEIISVVRPDISSEDKEYYTGGRQSLLIIVGILLFFINLFIQWVLKA